MSDKPSIFDLWDATAVAKAGNAAPHLSLVEPIHEEGVHRYAAVALEREAVEVATAPQGQRNHTLNRAWFNMGRHIGAGTIDLETVRGALLNAARACGLDEDEISLVLRDDNTSGVANGQQTPRHPDPNYQPTQAPAATVLDDADTDAHDAPTTTEGDDTEAVEASWAPADLTDVLDGTYEPELPSLMPRADGACLLYPGRIHSFHGESESGKSLVAQAEAARLIADAHDVLFVDFESDKAAVVGRLLELGATRQQIRAHFTYVRPDVDPRRFAHEREAVAALLAHSYALAVLDGVTEALGIFGASTKDNDEITAFMRLLPRAVARETGAAVVLVDHVTKDSEGRGRFAIGGQAKMAALDGAAYVVEVAEALGRGRRGLVVLRVAKDRPGGVRAHAGEFRRTDRTQEAARLVIDSTDPAAGIRVSVENPTDGAHEFRPTHVMEKVSEFLEKSAAPMSQNTIVDGVGGRADTVRTALALLIRDGFVSTSRGSRNSVLHTPLKPYRESSDPASNQYVRTLQEPVDNPVDNDCVPPRPTTSRDAVDVTASQPLRSRAGTGRGQAGSEPVTASQSTERPDQDPLVACRKCHRPTVESYADGHGGRCANCSRDAGQIDEASP